MKRTLITLGLAACLFAGVVYAQTGMGVVANQLKAINACSNITTRIANRITNSNNFRNKHVDNYISAKEKVTTLLAKLEAKGYDVTKINADLEAYQVLLSNLSADYSSYITALTATQNYACGKSEGEFRTQLEAARAQLKVVHADDVMVHDYWKNTIKVDLQALKNQTPKTTTSTTGGTN